MFGKLAKVLKGGVKAINAVNKIPIVGTAMRAMPIVGTAMGAASVFNEVSKFTGGGGGSSMPSLPAGVPALPGTANAPAIVGNRGIFQNDPNIAAALQPWAISKTNLRTAYRSPMKGYVVVRDQNGDPYALPKELARRYAGWRPSKKPPISVGDWEAVKRADRTVKKVRKVMTTMTRVDKAVGKGGKIKIKSKAKG